MFSFYTDWSSIEVFNGEKVITDLIFPAYQGQKIVKNGLRQYVGMGGDV
ncbi:GH32 C-terminal domain-containing protein [Lederbergia lenta]